MSRTVLVVVVLAAAIVPFSHAGDLSFEKRVAAQRAIEEVYWRHRSWPRENPAAKPDLSAVMSDGAFRAKVRDYLEKSSALEILWHRPISASQLQAELDRMARNTRDGATLRELFVALGNDAELIAETLVREALADRLVRDFYAADDRFHAELRDKAELALAFCDDVDCLRSLGRGYRETTWRLRRQGAIALEHENDETTILLDAGEWEDRLEHLRGLFGRPPGALPVRTLSGIDETPDAFIVTSVLAHSENELTTATQIWPKVPFDNWWTATRGSLDGAVEIVSGDFALPAVLATGCTSDSWSPSVIPDPTHDHTAVWTGSEMIVWGGFNNGFPNRDTGGRYDPATDTWSRTSTGPGNPQGRARHTAVWTGTEMIVWGGQAWDTNSLSYPNSGGRYDPSTDTWAETSTGTSVPSGRMRHGAVWTGTELIVWGGMIPDLVSGEIWMNDGGRYDPLTDAWAPTSTGPGVPEPRSYPAMVWAGTEMIIWGGAQSSPPYDYLDTGGRYDSSSDTWLATPTTDAPDGRSGSSAVWTGTEVIVWGGVNDDGYLATGGRLDPSTGSWTPTSTGASVPAGRYRHTSVWTGAEMIVWGGTRSGDPFLNTGARYDPSMDLWTPVSAGANVPGGRYWHTAVWTGTEMVVWGGYVGGINPDLNTGGRYDPTSNTWVPTSIGGTPPAARHEHTAVWTGAEMIVWGGEDGTTLMNSGGRYNPATDTWVATSMGAGVPEARSDYATVWTGTEMIVWGGAYGSPAVYLDSGGRYNPALDSWVPTSTGGSSPAPRWAPSAVWTGTEMIVWGGVDATGRLNTGGRYSPSSDAWQATSVGANVPAPRYRQSAVWTGTEMIVWGGFDTGFLDTGGRYDPWTDTWAATSNTPGVPSARVWHSAVWTGMEMIVWGGNDGQTLGLNTGGRYDPTTETWTPTSTEADLLHGRIYHTTIWTGTEMIVWSGDGSAGTWSNTGDRYSPALDTWTPTSTGTGVPSGRRFFTAVWTGTEMIVWGGDQNSALYLDSTGSYCVDACAAPSVYYQDSDADGHGNPTVSVLGCAKPSGYADNGMDCEDTNANTHPGAPEVNDGVDNQCPGDAGYGAVDEISGMTSTGEPPQYCWDAQLGATSYEVARALDPTFEFACQVFVTTETCWSDGTIPWPGHTAYQLVRAAGPMSGSWGQDSTGAERGTICPPNLVSNGDMEVWNSSIDLASWSETTTGGSVNEEADLAHVFLGVRSARLTRTGSGVLNVVNPAVPFIPGATYSLNFAGKSSLILSGVAQVRIRNVTRGEDLQDDGTWSSSINFINFDLTMEYQWQELQFVVDPSHSSTDNFRLVIRDYPGSPIGSELWIDGVAVVH